ncbi:MAG TPA: glycosyltransferase family 4 protein [Acidimicrobiia bacterium]|nr:glycosyltransferase family 4 protein [Acidimicrobiia bacterium]
MKIGLVCPYDIGKPGGVQQLTGELATHLRMRGLAVTFVGAGTRWFHGGPELDAITVPAGRAMSIRANQSKAPLTLSPTRWPHVRGALDDVDVIHIHEPFIPMVGWMGLSVDKPTVATFHSDPAEWVRGAYRWAPGVSRKLRRGVVTAVSATAASAIPESWGDVRIVPNAIDVEKYRIPTGRIERRVAFLGRDEPRKGLSVLLEAWPSVIDAVPGAQLVVMGADRGIDMEGVKWMGPVSGGEKRRLLASSRVYVAPNLGGESFGIVIVEAMAAGCAVIASDLAAFVDVSGGAARHVPVGDAEALGAEIINVLSDHQVADAMAAASRERVTMFDWQEVVDSYIDLYEEVLS